MNQRQEEQSEFPLWLTNCYRGDVVGASTSAVGASMAVGRGSGRKGEASSSEGWTSPPTGRGASFWARCTAGCCSRRCRPSSVSLCRTAGSQRRRWDKPRRTHKTSDNVFLQRREKHYIMYIICIQTEKVRQDYWSVIQLWHVAKYNIRLKEVVIHFSLAVIRLLRLKM